MAAWENAGYETDYINSVTPDEFAQQLTPETTVVDVRRIGEINAGKMEHNNLIHLCLDDINHQYKQLDKNKEYYVHCAGGYRSLIAISILNQKGFNHLVNVDQGFNGIKDCGKIPCLEGTCAGV